KEHSLTNWFGVVNWRNCDVTSRSLSRQALWLIHNEEQLTIEEDWHQIPIEQLRCLTACKNGDDIVLVIRDEQSRVSVLETLLTLVKTLEHLSNCHLMIVIDDTMACYRYEIYGFIRTLER